VDPDNLADSEYDKYAEKSEGDTGTPRDFGGKFDDFSELDTPPSIADKSNGSAPINSVSPAASTAFFSLPDSPKDYASSDEEYGSPENGHGPISPLRPLNKVDLAESPSATTTSISKSTDVEDSPPVQDGDSRQQPEAMVEEAYSTSAQLDSRAGCKRTDVEDSPLIQDGDSRRQPAATVEEAHSISAQPDSCENGIDNSAHKEPNGAPEVAHPKADHAERNPQSAHAQDVKDESTCDDAAASVKTKESPAVVEDHLVDTGILDDVITRDGTKSVRINETPTFVTFMEDHLVDTGNLEDSLLAQSREEENSETPAEKSRQEMTGGEAATAAVAEEDADNVADKNPLLRTQVYAEECRQERTEGEASEPEEDADDEADEDPLLLTLVEDCSLSDVQEEDEEDVLEEIEGVRVSQTVEAVSEQNQQSKETVGVRVANLTSADLLGQNLVSTEEGIFKTPASPIPVESDADDDSTQDQPSYIGDIEDMNVDSVNGGSAGAVGRSLFSGVQNDDSVSFLENSVGMSDDSERSTASDPNAPRVQVSVAPGLAQTMFGGGRGRESSETSSGELSLNF